MATGRSYPYGKRNSYGGRMGRRHIGPARLILMLAVICVMILVVRSRIYVIREIEVTGNETVSASEIAGLSGLVLGQNIFKVDKAAVERNLLNNNYVELLEVETVLPETVVLRVRERKPAAAVNCAGVILLTDAEGYILGRMAGLPSDEKVIVISGMNVVVAPNDRMIGSASGGQMESMKRLLAAIEEAQAEKLISEMNVADSDNLYLVTQSGIQVMLGDGEQLDKKLTWMKAVLEKLTDEGIMRGVIDVTSGKNATYADR